MTFTTTAREAGRSLILEHHYSHSFHPAFVIMGCALTPDGECIAACCFRTPPAKWKIPVLELARLVRKGGVGLPLTWLISQTVKAVREHARYNLLISNADATHEHHGSVYQACSDRKSVV